MNANGKSPKVYYNEFDAKAAAWLRELIKKGHIAYGEVDERSITEVQPTDLAGYTQCHFFAGIGGWSHALRLAGWPDDRPVWTGSCPCQPFSIAGRRGGTDDARHLWPEFYRLIRERRPSTIFGEQVASKDGLAWLDIVSTDLEGADYAIGAADLCAAGVGAPHIRQRLYFAADANSERRTEQHALLRAEDNGRLAAQAILETAWSGQVSELAEPAREQSVADDGVMGHASRDGRQQRRSESSERGVVGGRWQGAEFLPCTDGKRRPIEPGTFPLAHGVPGRVGLLRGYGNAIVPQVAATFIEAYSQLQNASEGK